MKKTSFYTYIALFICKGGLLWGCASNAFGLDAFDDLDPFVFDLVGQSSMIVEGVAHVEKDDEVAKAIKEWGTSDKEHTTVRISGTVSITSAIASKCATPPAVVPLQLELQTAFLPSYLWCWLKGANDQARVVAFLKGDERKPQMVTVFKVADDGDRLKRFREEMSWASKILWNEEVDLKQIVEKHGNADAYPLLTVVLLKKIFEESKDPEMKTLLFNRAIRAKAEFLRTRALLLAIDNICRNDKAESATNSKLLAGYLSEVKRATDAAGYWELLRPMARNEFKQVLLSCSDWLVMTKEVLKQTTKWKLDDQDIQKDMEETRSELLALNCPK